MISSKPAVCIFQNLRENIATKIKNRGQLKLSHFIRTENDLKFTCGENSGNLNYINSTDCSMSNGVIMKVANFAYSTITNSPIFTIVSICSGEMQHINECFEHLCCIQKWSMVVVGTFDIRKLDLRYIHGFKVLNHFSEDKACIGFFAYKNKSSVIIELCDPKSEEVEPQHNALLATMHLRVRPMDYVD